MANLNPTAQARILVASYLPDRNSMTNTLLSFTGLPPFKQIQASEIEPAIKQLLDELSSAVAAASWTSWSAWIARLKSAADAGPFFSRFFSVVVFGRRRAHGI